ITVTDIESQIKTRFTADTLAALKKRMPRARFIWLIGADNLSGIVAWQQWSRIFHLSPIAVVGRPTYSLRALNSKASIRFKSSRRNSPVVRAVGQKSGAPLWTFIFCRLHDASSSEIRHNAAVLR
ncbi:MAG: nicotinic acid mononucleotide adenylyltransferase, partial [Pseudomonadota bacterium]